MTTIFTSIHDPRFALANKQQQSVTLLGAWESKGHKCSGKLNPDAIVEEAMLNEPDLLLVTDDKIETYKGTQFNTVPFRSYSGNVTQEQLETIAEIMEVYPEKQSVGVEVPTEVAPHVEYPTSPARTCSFRAFSAGNVPVQPVNVKYLPGFVEAAIREGGLVPAQSYYEYMKDLGEAA